MSNVVKKNLVVLVVLFFSIGLAMAEGQEQKRDQKKDGSCQDAIEFDADSILAKDQKRDGSCQG